MAESSEQELRRKRRKRLVKGLVLGGAAIGVPALLNVLVSKRARGLPDTSWGSRDRYPWDTGSVAYQHLGEGPPLLLLHSFGPGHSSAEWRESAVFLAENFQVFAPDLPGWGQSDPVPHTIDDRLYGAWLEDFLHGVVGGPAVLVAAGLTASYAVRFAVANPESVRALALVVPTGIETYGDDPDLKDSVVHGLLRVPVLGTSALNVFTSRAGTEGYLRKEVYASGDLVDDALVDLYYTNSHRKGAHRSLAAYVGGLLNHDVREALGQVSCPVWVAWGRRARSPVVEMADLWLQRLGAAELEVFEQGGILPHAESPEEFARKLERFLIERDFGNPAPA
ncbi:MAG: alpha/beta hydrolase [Acidobacteriota bacterium]